MADWAAGLGMVRLEIRSADLDDPVAVQLIAELNAEIQDRYDESVEQFYLQLDAAEVAPGRGAFVLASVADQVVGCGAVRIIGDDTAELKRMYVVPACRRRGVAAAILRSLEAEALGLGASRVVLETVRDPPAAVGLYRAAGYVEIAKFGPYLRSKVSFCMGKKLGTA